MRQRKRGRKSTPFFAWLSFWMKKLRPKSSAKIAYILPPKMKKAVSHTAWSSPVGSGNE